MENQLPVGFGQRRAYLVFDLRIAVHQPAALLDVIQFCLSDTLGFARSLINFMPDQRPDDADPTGDDKHPVPAQYLLNPD
ncbi:hypothetical protein D3C72_1632830 [compost metagenome]